LTSTTGPEAGAGSPPPEGASGGYGVRRPDSGSSHPTAQRILAAAKKIITERGYQAMTLQAISLEARVNKAGVWYYFGGKQQLVRALLEDVTVNESLHFGDMPPEGAGVAERVELIVGGVAQVEERVRRYAAFYELLPEASRDDDLHAQVAAYYRAWYEWAAEVLAPAGPAAAWSAGGSGRTAELGQFASVLLDGVFMQLVVGAPGFDLPAALGHAREALRHMLESGEAAGGPD
jgi:AcrR family transcriptional regulator